MKIFRIKEMSVPGAMITSGIISGLIIGLSVFLTTWIFFGGDNNRQKLFTPNPINNIARPMPQNTLTPEQIRQMQQAQQQRMQQQQQTAPVVNTAPATNTAPIVKPPTKK